MSDPTPAAVPGGEPAGQAVVNGWTLFAHPLLIDQIDDLVAQVERLRQKDPVGYTRKNAAKRLAAINKLVFEAIPQDPTRADYRQGDTLGDEHKHWFGAKFFQQYRLFFRYDLASRVIVFAWTTLGADVPPLHARAAAQGPGSGPADLTPGLSPQRALAANP